MDNEKLQRIGIMGGTFDPIHFGHLVLAETVRETMKLDKILFIPTGDPPHKKDQNVTSAKQRLEMVELAISDNPDFYCSNMEVDREGFSYTVDTLERLRETCGENCKLFFITGADAIIEILSWKNVERISNLCTFVAAARPGTGRKKLSDFLEDLPGYLQNKIHVTQVPALQISSTDIRKKVASGLTIRYLLPAAVEQYIKDNRLYIQGNHHE
ncbi:nicotinate-nucleotide adenylyltransferase [Clostridia bacterium]|nr:nicotinate-nucleotide adenylyltransferase [Clostridia bacterium]